MMQRIGRVVAATALVAAGIFGASAQAFSAPQPPTNGGNGAGQSGQCTGPASERPTSCQSPGGVSDRQPFEPNEGR
ncbi:hypothetical protein FBY35_7000 [Streptomyces sp. SLBN-118]|uniref:hypothetical protein n=1 Tax=Streptomyces sp. SLBN-118 TaxID=2768454 RepID=UPI001153C958|nr:hypothetical protein [Streptomyces sp. SLBN-118]TQK45435.1 hypothetical protein FBY35_7000 [Streptomyces sp. SLBN-118]